MKGIILAGGYGQRLYPLTKAVIKQLLPVYDKPLIYYPLSVLMLAKIREVLIISTPSEINRFKELFGNGNQLGMHFEYAVQEKPAGLADAFIVGKNFIGKENVALVLGDNIFYGQNFTSILQNAVNQVEQNQGAMIFGYYFANPSAYGVIDFEKNGKIKEIVEKPDNPPSNYAVPGLYFYDNSVVDIAQNIKPGPRGELEITSVNNEYIKKNQLKVQLLGRGMAWLDTGTYESLQEAGNYVATIQKRQGLYVACIEEIAFKNGWINKNQLISMSKEYKTDYGKYLEFIANSQD